MPGGDGHAIDLAGRFVKGGDGKNVFLRAIFEIQGDTLRLCCSYNDDTQRNERPAGFETEVGRPGLCVTFKRSD